MEALSDLLNGFATALTPTNLAWAALGVILGTAVGVLPGIGPAMTVALLLPVTYGLEPTAAFIMFAGIFYGGMFGGSTTSILLNTPGESSSVITAIEGNLMARNGRASQALATAAIGSFVAGLIGTMLLVLLAPAIVDLAVGISAADYFAIMMLAFIAVTAVLGSSRIRGFASLVIGLTLGLIGIDLATGQQRLTFGIPQLADGIDVVVEAVGAWHRARLPVRGVAGRRGRDPDVPVLRHREAPLQAQGGVRPRRHRGRRRARGQQQRLGRRDPGADADPRAAHQRDRRGDAGRLHRVRHPARPPAVPARGRPGLGPDRQPVHRQHPAADPQPAPGPALGQAAAHPAALPVRRHPVLRLGRRLRGQRQHHRPDDPARHRPARVRHAPLRPPGGAGDHRRHPRPPGRAAAAAGPQAQQRGDQRAVELPPRPTHLSDHRRRPAVAADQPVRAPRAPSAGRGGRRGRRAPGGGAATGRRRPRPGGAAMTAPMVVGVDGTGSGLDAVALAARLAQATGDPLLVACVYPEGRRSGFDAAAVRGPAAQALEAARALAEEAPAEYRTVPSSSPARGLAELAEEEDAAMVVVGSHRGGAFGRVASGGTAERLLHGSGCPVAVAPRGYRRRVTDKLRRGRGGLA